jgi:hypothetical protein
VVRLTSKCYEGIQRLSATRGDNGIISRSQRVNSALSIETPRLTNLDGVRHGDLTTTSGYLMENVMGENTNNLVGCQIGEESHDNGLVRHLELFW